MVLGDLQELHDKLYGRPMLQGLVKRMAEIDSRLTKSKYGTGRLTGEDDVPPDGDDYNLLWDAILDQLHAEVEGS